MLLLLNGKDFFLDPEEVNESNILYLITGNLPQGPEADKIRYIGITTK